MNRRRSFLAASLASMAATRAWGQSTAPTRVIVGFAPGGAADNIARHLSARMRLETGGAVLVESRPGAGGRLAVEAVKNATPDGLTMLVTPGSILTIYPHVYTKLSYVPLRDLQPVTSLVSVPYSINVGPMVPTSVKTMKDLAQWCKANPDKASYGSPGAGTTPHFLGVMFGRETGLSYNHVPYRGGALALQDVMGGQIASSVAVVSEVVPSAQAGRVRVLAVSSGTRLAQLPDVPTFAESGFANLQSAEWFGLLAPAGTPAAVVAKLNRAATDAVNQPEVKKAMNDIAFSISTSTPEEFAALIKRDIDRWGPVVKSTGFSIED